MTWDGTAEPVSRDKLSGANGDRKLIFIFPVQLTTSVTLHGSSLLCYK